MTFKTEEARIAAFRAAVEEGEAELDRGEGIRWTDTTMREILADVERELDRNPGRSKRR